MSAIMPQHFSIQTIIWDKAILWIGFCLPTFTLHVTQPRRSWNQWPRRVQGRSQHLSGELRRHQRRSPPKQLSAGRQTHAHCYTCNLNWYSVLTLKPHLNPSIMEMRSKTKGSEDPQRRTRVCSNCVHSLRQTKNHAMSINWCKMVLETFKIS